MPRPGALPDLFCDAVRHSNCGEIEMPWKFRICIDGKWLESETHFDTNAQALDAMVELVVMLAGVDVIRSS
jgi:hypothetical protein